MSDTPTPPQPPRKLDPVMLVYGASLIVLAAGLGWLVLTPAAPPATGRMEALEARMARLEQRPVTNVDLSPLDARVGALVEAFRALATPAEAA